MLPVAHDIQDRLARHAARTAAASPPVPRENPLFHAHRFLTRGALSRLDAGLQRLVAGDREVSRARLTLEARECLAGVLPLHGFIEGHDRVLGTVGFALALLTLGSGFALLTALGTQDVVMGVTSGLSAVAGGALLMAASVLTNRIEMAVALARDVLAELEH
jgi:hypothetical protein